MKKENFQRGITLIALVVTIIVLIILAGVSINMVIGDNGIITQAQKAAEDTDLSQNYEEENLKEYESYINRITREQLPKSEGTQPYYPSKDFYKLEGTDLLNGLVISNGIDEYVWIIVPNSGENAVDYSTVESEEDYDNIEQSLLNYTDSYSGFFIQSGEWRDISDFHDEWFSEELQGISEDNYRRIKNKMLSSIYKNGGFWIGRYEAGDYTATQELQVRTNESGTSGKMVTARNMLPYNYITCSEAQKLAYLEIEDSIRSLLFEVQERLVYRFLVDYAGMENLSITKDSTSWGNYSSSSFELNRGKYNTNANQENSIWKACTEDTESIVENSVKFKDTTILYTTGASDNNCIMNIYDFAGNVNEWGLGVKEGFVTYGNGRYKGDIWPVSQRGTATSDVEWDSFGFRVTIY